MAIFKRPGSPYYYTEFEFRSRRVVRSTRTASARDAHAFERRLRDEIARETPKPSAAPSLTVDQACGKYWAQHGKKLADARNVERWLKYVVAFIGERDTPLHEISAKHVTAMTSAMETNGIGRIAINRTVTCLQGVHNMAAKKWEESVKVIDWRQHKTKERARTRWITTERAQILLAALPLHIRLLVLFLLTTGLRKREAFTLVWARVHFETCTVNVRVKGGEDREVLLAPEALLVLQEVPRASRYVFDTTNWRKHFEAALAKADVENFRWHDLRHTFATWLGQSGAPLEVIRDQLGHSSIAVTQKYRHVVQREVREALQRLPSLSPSSDVVVQMKKR